ncbi:MAG: lamin tail domain-containing protein, partial [Candidatus Omnitrophica bacterium]|nr:lamin tail domain-containing protein [Candidatus Omnitrophota bacterium]
YPWDLDLTWDIGTRDLWNTLGQFPGGGPITEDPAFTPDWWFYQAEPFFTRLMSIPEYREEYVTGVRDQLRTVFSERQLFRIVEQYGVDGQAAFERDKVIWPQVSGGSLTSIAEDFKDRVKRARQAAFWRARNEDLDGYTIPPVLSDGRTDPMVPGPGNLIQFHVNALSAGSSNLSEGIDTVTLRYRLNGGNPQSAIMFRAALETYDGDYRYFLAAQPERTTIEYWFETVDDLGLTDRLPASGSFQTEVVTDPTPSASQITISEIMYHSDLLGNEWIEIENRSSRFVDISEWSLGDSSPEHRFEFPVDLVLAPGERLVIASNEFVVREQYGIENVFGDFDFNFGNGGDTVRLFNSEGTLIDSVEYTDESPWPRPPDGQGPSLELGNEAIDNADPANWSSSVASRGTPGETNGVKGDAPTVVINECSYDPNEFGTIHDYNGDGVPDEAADEFVELYNATDSPIDLSGWTLDDDNPANGNTFTFPAGAEISARSYVVVFGGGSPTGFGIPTFTGLPRLGNAGDQVRLNDGTREVDSIGFEDAAMGTLNNL